MLAVTVKVACRSCPSFGGLWNVMSPCLGETESNLPKREVTGRRETWCVKF